MCVGEHGATSPSTLYKITAKLEWVGFIEMCVCVCVGGGGGWGGSKAVED